MTPPSMSERYGKARDLLPEQLPALMRNRAIDPQWTGVGDQFWYRRDGADGDEYVLVDPDGFTRQPLPAPPEDARPTPGTLPSPDGRTEVFRRDHDLWLRDRETGAERRLTTTGEALHAWGAPPDYTRAILPIPLQDMPLPPMLTGFSPSGRLLLTARMDERDTPEHPLVDHLPADRAKPRLRPFRSYVGDDTAKPEGEFAIIDVTSGETLVHGVSEDVVGSLGAFGPDMSTWDDDETAVYVFAHESGAKTASLQRIDVRTGDVTVVLGETLEPLYEPNTHLYSLPLVRVLPESREVIWFSLRDGWGHLYRYDLDSGTRLNAITTGELVVRDILRVDGRDVLFLAGTSADGGNPYWRRLYRASLDGGSMTLLTPEPADHELKAPAPAYFTAIFGVSPTSSISPSGRYFVDHLSTVAQPPEILLRETGDGAVVGVLEKTDVSALLAAGYQLPQQFQVTADDGSTPLWGALTLPPDPVDPDRIPVIDLMYAGFQVVHQPPGVLHGGGDPAGHELAAAYSALGFATVVLDGRGTPGRDRTFRQWTREQPGEPRGLADHVTAIRALADRFPTLDVGRVGVTGHSFGGYNTVRSMLFFPEFFKVGVSSCGVHDALKMPRGTWNWFLGPDKSTDPEAMRALGNLHLADRLRGKLLLIGGEQDVNATIDHTFALVRAFMAADKRFDLKVWPGMDHYLGVTPYMRAIAWDHFVEHLLGVQPPDEL